MIPGRQPCTCMRCKYAARQRGLDPRVIHQHHGPPDLLRTIAAAGATAVFLVAVWFATRTLEPEDLA